MDIEAPGYMDFIEEKPIKPREVSPCITCKWKPIDVTSEPLSDSPIYEVHEKCPMSIDLGIVFETDLELMIEDWEILTRLIGCSCYRQEK